MLQQLHLDLQTRLDLIQCNSSPVRERGRNRLALQKLWLRFLVQEVVEAAVEQAGRILTAQAEAVRAVTQ
jgi:hypothetical protein